MWEFFDQLLDNQHLTSDHMASHQSITWVQYLSMILTIATLATVVGAQRRSGNEQHPPWAQRTGRRMLSQQWQHVQMPPQHRLLPAQNSFLAVCAVVKVGYIQVRQHTSILTLTHRMSTKTLWSGWCTTWRLVWATFTCAWKCVHMFLNITCGSAQL